MSNVNGIVEAVTSKPVNTKFGPKPTYTIKVDGEWYKCGFTKPKCNNGDSVSFAYTEGTYGKEVDAKAIVVSGGGASPTSSPATPSKPFFAGGGKGVFPIPPLDGQRAIVRQNSITNAVALMKDVLAADKKLSNDEKATQVIAVARMFEAYSCGDLDLAKAKEMAKKPVAKAAEEVNPFEEEAA